jgi:hypothetical protein
MADSSVWFIKESPHVLSNGKKVSLVCFMPIDFVLQLLEEYEWIHRQKIHSG